MRQRELKRRTAGLPRLAFLILCTRKICSRTETEAETRRRSFPRRLVSSMAVAEESDGNGMTTPNGADGRRVGIERHQDQVAHPGH
jgi:hypothetical protein